MKQNHLSIDFKYTRRSGNIYTFGYDVKRSVIAATDITIQNWDGNLSLPAYYNIANDRLYAFGVNGYWYIGFNYLVFTSVESVDSKIASLEDNLESLTSRVDVIENYIRSMVVYRTVSGNPVIFSDAKAVNFQNVAVAIIPTQAGSGDPSPTNVRLISGVSSATITRKGENGANSQSVAFSFVDGNNNPLTVYGGTLDATAGTLTVTHAFYAFTNGSAWTQGQAGTVNQYYTASTSVAANNQTARNENFMCSHFIWESIWSGSTGYGISIYDSSVYFRYLSLFPTLADFSAWIDAQYANGTPLQVCYPIRTPVTYQLTAGQLSALSGYNNVSSDAGTLSIIYESNPSIIFG